MKAPVRPLQQATNKIIVTNDPGLGQLVDKKQQVHCGKIVGAYGSKIYFSSVTISGTKYSCRSPDCYVMNDNSIPFRIRKIFIEKDSVSFVCCGFTCVTDAYRYPMYSRQLGIVVLSDERHRTTILSSDVKKVYGFERL